jgi:hypothetical protein
MGTSDTATGLPCTETARPGLRPVALTSCETEIRFVRQQSIAMLQYGKQAYFRPIS